jgi:hypothetical protein
MYIKINIINFLCLIKERGPNTISCNAISNLLAGGTGWRILAWGIPSRGNPRGNLPPRQALDTPPKQMLLIPDISDVTGPIRKGKRLCICGTDTLLIKKHLRIRNLETIRERMFQICYAVLYLLTCSDYIVFID